MKNWLGETPFRILVIAAVIAALALTFFAVRILLVPFVAALFVVYLFDPAVVILQRRGLERGPAFLLLLTFVLVAISVMLAFMPAWLRSESAAYGQNFAERFTSQLNVLEQWLNSTSPMFGTVRLTSQVTAKSAQMAAAFFEDLPALLTDFVINLMLVPFIAYFMIRDGKRLKRRLVEMASNRYFEMTLIMFMRIDRQIGGYLRGRLIECILVAVTQALLMGVAAVFVPQQDILLIAAVCGATNIIPYIGPILGTAFGVFLFVGAGLPLASILGFLVASGGAQVIDNMVISPAVLSHNVDLHPLSVALVLVIGGELLGTLGVLIAIPVAASIKVVAQEFYTNYRLQVRT
jgi:predicted PurR-regulated permease PerM